METRAPGSGRAATLGQVLIFVGTAAALAASAALLVDYVRPSAVFCDDAGAGCARLRTTAFAAVLGVPTPAVGLGAFVVMGALALLRSARARLAHLALAAAAALVAAFLLSVQVRLATFCRFCVVVDVSAILVFAGAMLRGRGAAEPAVESASPGWYRRGGAPTFLLAAALPLVFGFTRPAPRVADGSPEGLWSLVDREMKATPAGQVTVVDFVDYECPFCRMTHETLSPILEKHAADVRLVRRQVPLRTIHPHAMDAAKAACCGEKLGADKAMTEALFTAPVEELTPTGCEKLAVKSGLDAAAFRACLADPATTARVEADVSEFKAAGGRSLPTVWIDDTKFVGAQDQATFERALERAIQAKKRTRG